MLELLTVVAIMGVVTAIAIPSFVNYYPHIQLKNVSTAIYSSLQGARAQAVGSSAHYGIRFDLSSTPPTLLLMTRPGSSSAWTQASASAPRSLEGAIYVNKVTVDGTAYTSGTTGVISFEPVGTASNATVVVQNARDTNDTISISVNPATGRVKIE